MRFQTQLHSVPNRHEVSEATTARAPLLARLPANWFKQFVAELLILFLSFSTLASDARAQAAPSSPPATPVSSSAPITVPAAIATGIGLASAANVRISSGATWKGYEDILVLAALNGIAKRAANASQT